MPAQLRRTVVPATDLRAAAQLVARILGIPPDAGPDRSERIGLANGVSLEFAEVDVIAPMHLTFEVTEDEFDAAYGRILDARVRTWSDHTRTRPTEIDHRDGGRGIYVEGPDGHLIELVARPTTWDAAT